MIQFLKAFLGTLVACFLFAATGAGVFLLVPGLFHLFAHPLETSVFFATGGCGGVTGVVVCTVGGIQSDDPMLRRCRKPIALAGLAAIVAVILVMIRGLTMVP